MEGLLCLVVLSWHFREVLSLSRCILGDFGRVAGDRAGLVTLPLSWLVDSGGLVTSITPELASGQWWMSGRAGSSCLGAEWSRHRQ